MKTKNEDIEVYVIGKPSFDDLEKRQKEALFNQLIDVIKEFYQNPENIKKYEEWLAKRNAEKK